MRKKQKHKKVKKPMNKVNMKKIIKKQNKADIKIDIKKNMTNKNNCLKKISNNLKKLSDHLSTKVKLILNIKYTQDSLPNSSPIKIMINMTSIHFKKVKTLMIMSHPKILNLSQLMLN